jgi:uncharacterized protein
MAEDLPKYVDTRRLVALTGSVSGVVAAARLQRIGAPYAASKSVAVEFELSANDGSELRLIGQIKTEVKATCQRCLEDMDVGIEKIFDVILVDASDSRPRVLDASKDVLAIVQGRIDVDQLVEDEVILGCPMIPLHDNPECRASLNTKDMRDEDRKRPFVGLADMIASATNNEDPE